jgi:hypothetical protein
MKLPSPFVFKILHTAGEDRRQGSSINSLRSALTAVLASRPDTHRKTKGDCERCLFRFLTPLKSVYHVLGTMCLPCPGLDRPLMPTASNGFDRFSPPE